MSYPWYMTNVLKMRTGMGFQMIVNRYLKVKIQVDSEISNRWRYH